LTALRGGSTYPEWRVNISGIDIDLRTILYLSSSQLHLDEEFGGVNEPFLITWDSAFYDARKRILNRFKNFCY